MPSRSRARARYAALAIVTIVLGLAVHLRGDTLPPSARDVLGDALWAAMVMWLIGVLAPSRSLWWRASAAAAVCVAVEFSQLLHQPALDAIRRTPVGHLVLGNSFDPRDLGAYGAGVLAATLVAWKTSATDVR